MVGDEDIAVDGVGKRADPRRGRDEWRTRQHRDGEERHQEEHEQQEDG